MLTCSSATGPRSSGWAGRSAARWTSRRRSTTVTPLVLASWEPGRQSSWRWTPARSPRFAAPATCTIWGAPGAQRGLGARRSAVLGRGGAGPRSSALLRAGAGTLRPACRAGAGRWGTSPDFRATILDQVAEGDRVVTRKVFHGTHLGPFQGIPPTGRQVEIHLIDIVRVADGQIVEHWNSVDRLGLLAQLGGLPPAINATSSEIAT
jgi:hypothetical protein